MWKTVTIGAMALLMAACTTVTTDVDKQADFASYKRLILVLKMMLQQVSMDAV